MRIFIKEEGLVYIFTPFVFFISVKNARVSRALFPGFTSISFKQGISHLTFLMWPSVLSLHTTIPLSVQRDNG